MCICESNTFATMEPDLTPQETAEGAQRKAFNAGGSSISCGGDPGLSSGATGILRPGKATKVLLVLAETSRWNAEREREREILLSSSSRCPPFSPSLFEHHHCSFIDRVCGSLQYERASNKRAATNAVILHPCSRAQTRANIN